MDFAAFSKLCDARCSAKEFGTEKVTKDQILELLSCAHLAPSVGNTQPWHFHVILEEKLQRTAREAGCYGEYTPNASAFIVVTCDKSSKPVKGEILWNPRELEYSCVVAMEHIQLAATAMGLAANWVSLHHGPVHEALNLQPHHVIIGGVLIGSRSPVQAAKHVRKHLEGTYTFYE